MTTGRMDPILQHVRRAALREDLARLTDGQLLEAFLRHQDAAAVDALVRRHSPMVWGVCRRILTRFQDAEDAFQATFLVLARKAATVSPRKLVGNWLYGVAHTTALRVRATEAKRRAREVPLMDTHEPLAGEPPTTGEVEYHLDRELTHLPAKYRAAVVLCDLEGRSRREGARQLNIPEGTLSSRLTTAHRLLAQRLRRCGMTLPSTLVASLPSQKTGVAAPAALVTQTVKAIHLLAVGHAATGIVSATVDHLTQGVLKMMLFSKVKFIPAALAMLVLISGSFWLCQHLAVAQAEEPNLALTQEPKADAAVPVANLVAAQPPDTPKPQPKKPWTGEPKRKWFNKEIFTFLRLPKASEVTSLRISQPLNKIKVNVTAASFPALLDSMQPVKATDPKFMAFHYAPWHHLEFETEEGKFQTQLYLGELALLHAPDGSLGLVTYAMPKEEPKAKLPGGKTSLSEAAKACKGALVATLMEISVPGIGPPGATDYMSKWKVEKVLRGTYPATASLSYRVQTLPEASRETPPTIGKTYILISYETNADQIAVILDANEENLRSVKELLEK